VKYTRNYMKQIFLTGLEERIGMENVVLLVT
jgi:hypothetical protein